MAKYFLATVLLLGLLGHAGCANREAPSRTSQRVSVAPRRQASEPSEVQEPGRTQAEPTDLEPEEAALRSPPIPEDVVPPAETHQAKAAEAGPETSMESVGLIEDTVAAEVNEPATVTPSAGSAVLDHSRCGRQAWNVTHGYVGVDVVSMRS